MRKLVLILIIILSASLLLLAGCDDVVQYEGVKVVFMLEGGTFQNGEGSVVYYYQFPEGAQNLIRPLEDFASDDDDLVKNGYDLEGWYLTKKTDKDGNVSYTDKWNFDTDTVDAEGVTLYACWKKTSQVHLPGLRLRHRRTYCHKGSEPRRQVQRQVRHTQRLHVDWVV